MSRTVKVAPWAASPTTLADPSAGAEWIRSPRGLSTVRVVPTICAVGLAVGLTAIDGAPVAVGEVRDDVLPHAAISAAVAVARTANLKRRARAGIRPQMLRWLAGRNRLRGATR